MRIFDAVEMTRDNTYVQPKEYSCCNSDRLRALDFGIQALKNGSLAPFVVSVIISLPSWP